MIRLIFTYSLFGLPGQVATVASADFSSAELETEWTEGRRYLSGSTTCGYGEWRVQGGVYKQVCPAPPGGIAATVSHQYDDWFRFYSPTTIICDVRVPSGMAFAGDEHGIAFGQAHYDEGLAVTLDEANDRVRLLQYDGGLLPVELTSVAYTIAPDTWYELEVRVLSDGEYVECDVDGTPVLSHYVPSSEWRSEGRAGVQTDSEAEFDNFSLVTDYPIEVAANAATAATTNIQAVSPNPVRAGSATIMFSLAQDGRVRMVVHDVSGRLVRLLIDEGFREGDYRVEWDRQTDRGTLAPAGVYFVRLESFPGKTLSTKIMVVR